MCLQNDHLILYFLPMKLSLSNHYDQMWQVAAPVIKKGNIGQDALIDDPADQRYGITLLTRPNAEVAHNIMTFLRQACQLEPEQYFYPQSDLHLTVLSIISCYAGFSLLQVDTEAYAEKVQEALQHIPAFDLEFRGITASTSTVLVQGFPGDDTLELLRNRLRKIFHGSGLQHSIDSRYKIVTAHSTVIRFRQPLREAEQFWHFLMDHRHTDFGTFTVSGLELLGNNWYQQKEKTQYIRRYTLSG